MDSLHMVSKTAGRETVGLYLQGTPALKIFFMCASFVSSVN
jgi:hypothetical protein